MTTPDTQYQQSEEGHDLVVNEAYIEERFIEKHKRLKASILDAASRARL